MKKLNPIYLLGRTWAKLSLHVNFCRFRKACQLAEELRAQTGRRFRVFHGKNGRYLCLCKENINLLKHRGIIDPKTETGILSKHCLYDSLTHQNTHPVFMNKKIKKRWHDL